MAIVQGSQGDRQACLLVCNQAFCRQHSYLPAFFFEGCKDEKNLCVVLWNMQRGGVNKLEMGVQILKLFQGVDFVLLTETYHFLGQQLSHVERFDSFVLARIV
jgi:hypothetical protein